MKYNREIAEKALKCCINFGRDNCASCPIKEECESNPLESVIAKYAYALVEDLKADCNIYKDYAYNMQAYVENVRNKEVAGYEPSAARYAAEMDMWINISLQRQSLEKEIERLTLENAKLRSLHEKGT